ncbi:hypothetical protein A9W95_19400 [Mycobacterium sp. 1423905.2]|nr:hypothetical protein A9W95_19400 [Mycobacterium sp. 1423905.2]
MKMGQVALSPEQAQQTLSNIEEQVRQVKSRQQDMRLRAEEMIQSSWHGGQARRFGEAMQAHDEDLTAVSNELDHVVAEARDKAKQIEQQAM